MEITVQTKYLKQALILTKRVRVDDKHIPLGTVLDKLQLSVVANELLLTATDGSTIVTAHITTASQVYLSGECLVHHDNFENIIKAAPSEHVTLTLLPGKVTEENGRELDPVLSVRAGGAAYTVPVYDYADTFPSAGEWHKGEPAQRSIAHAEVSAGVLAEHVRSVLYAVSDSAIRVHLNGVNMEFVNRGDFLRLTSSDGHRLALTDCPTLSQVWKGNDTAQIIAEVEALEVLKAYARVDDSCLLRLSVLSEGKQGLTDTLCVSTSQQTYVRFELYSRAVAGQYPNYRQIMPSSDEFTQAKVNTRKLIEVVKAAKPARAGKNKSIKLSLTNGKLTVNVWSYGLEAYNADVDAEIRFTASSELREVHVDPDYLLETLDTLPKKSTAVIEVEDGTLRPLKVYADGAKETYAVIMPMRD